MKLDMRDALKALVEANDEEILDGLSVADMVDFLYYNRHELHYILKGVADETED